jgi:membrane fusion protein (multidrug efflux system)
MAVIPLDQVWVDANFKEGQLQQMRIGQPVTLTSDVYGSHIEYHGKVAGLAAGTGSAFALLPAQNATGNWIKVVQRVPVRIALDPAELGEHPLRVGLSMQVDVDVRDQSGKQLAEGGARQEPIARTEVFSGESEGADALVKQIIATNLHGAPAQDIPPLARRGESTDPAAQMAGDAPKKQPLIRTKLQLAH